MNNNKNRLFEMMNRITGMPLNENEAFNDNSIDDTELDWKTRLLKDLSNNGIYPNTYIGKIYNIKCKGGNNFEIQFYNDGIKTVEFDDSTQESNENIFKEYDDALDYILSKQNLFKTNSNNIVDLR